MTSRRKAVLVAIALAIAACVAGFLLRFDFNVPQWIDGLWLLAIVLWAVLVAQLAQAPKTMLLPRPRDYLPFAIVLPLFAACWLRFYDNWRWAFTGDSFGIFAVGYWFGRLGPNYSLLSVHGIDGFYTRMWEAAYNWLMYVVEPSLFWHRMGQLVMASLALTAIYTFFCRILGRWWATLIVLGTITNYVWIWISYISYQRTDSFVFYFSTLILGLGLWHAPERLRLWMAAGLVGGLSLFFTPVVWGAVAAVAVVNGLREMRHRRWRGIAVYTLSFGLAALPILIELPWMMEMLGEQSIARDANAAVYWPEPIYWWRTYRTIVLSGYYTPISVLGVDGAFLRVPLDHMYLVGLALAALAVIAPLRRWLRIPTAAPVLLALLLFDALLFTLTNKGYGSPSHKRFYNLIPLEVFFALLPLLMLARLSERWRVLRMAAQGIAIVAVAGAAIAGFLIILEPNRGMYGGNMHDGLIELRQRFAERPVTLVSARIGIDEMLARDSLMNETYGIVDHLTRHESLSDEARAALCGGQALLCYDMRGVADEVVDAMAQQPSWRPFPLLNSHEIRCFECVGN